MATTFSDKNGFAKRYLFICRANVRRQMVRLSSSCLCLILSLTAVGASSGGIASTRQEIVGTAVAASLIFGPIILILLGQYLRLRFRQIAIYEEGAAIILGSHLQRFHWNEFSALTIRRLRDRDVGVVLYVNRRKVLTINQNYQDAEILTKIIALRTAEALISRYLETYRLEGAISLGQLQISLNGIDYRGRHLAWREIHSWRFEGNFLNLYKIRAEVGLSIYLYAMKNGYLLPWLLESIYSYSLSDGPANPSNRVLPMHTTNHENKP